MTQIHFKHLALRGQMPATEKVRAIMSLRRQREEEDHGGRACRGWSPWLHPSGYVRVRWRTVRWESGVLESETRDSQWKHEYGRDAKRFGVSVVKLTSALESNWPIKRRWAVKHRICDGRTTGKCLSYSLKTLQNDCNRKTRIPIRKKVLTRFWLHPLLQRRNEEFHVLGLYWVSS